MLLLLAALIGFGFVKGMKHTQAKWDAAIAEQATKSAGTVIKGAENTAAVVMKYIKIKGETQVRTEIVEKEVIRYVDAPHPSCVLDAQFERVWDDANGLPPSSSPPGGAAPRPADLEAATVLSAHAGDARAYVELKDRYAALVEWVKTSYALQKAGAGK